MPGALVMRQQQVSSDARAEYLRTLRQRRAHYHGAGCRFWVFEHAEQPGSFVEFTESRVIDVLSSARADDGHADASAPILIEVELS